MISETFKKLTTKIHTDYKVRRQSKILKENKRNLDSKKTSIRSNDSSKSNTLENLNY